MSYLKYLFLAILLCGMVTKGNTQVLDNEKEGIEQLSEDGIKQTPSPKVYDVPFASRGNRLQLTVANSSGRNLENIVIEVTNVPSWIEMEKTKENITVVEESEEMIEFLFHLKEKAPVGEKAELRFTAMSSDKFSWEKQISLKVAPPTSLEVDPNYPNPFNQSTTMEYRLPAQMKVKVTIYNVLGQRVATVVDEMQQAGHQEMRWNASGMASGLYFCRIVAEGQDKNKIVEQQKMMLIR